MPAIRHPDDVIVVLYALLAVAFAVQFRRVLLVDGGLVLFGLTGAFLGTTALLDVLAGGTPEELAEPGASASLLAGFAAVTVDHLADPHRPAYETSA